MALGQPIPTVRNEVLEYDVLSPPIVKYDTPSPPIVEYDHFDNKAEIIVPGINPRFNQDSSTTSLVIPDTTQYFDVNQKLQKNQQISTGSKTSILQNSNTLKKDQETSIFLKGDTTSIILRKPKSQTDQTTQIFRDPEQSATFGNIVNEASPPPDAQFSDGYSAPLPENKSPAVFSSSFVPDTTYVAPENNVVQTDATFQQPIENNFIDNEADDYGSPEAPIVTSFDSDNTGTNFISELPPMQDTMRYQTINRNPTSTEQSSRNPVYNGHSGLASDGNSNIKIDINVYVNDDEKATVYSSSSQGKNPMFNSHGPVSTTYRGPTSSNLPTTTGDVITDAGYNAPTTSYTTINRPGNPTNSRPVVTNGATNPSNSFQTITEEYNEPLDNSFTNNNNDDYGSPIANVLTKSDEYSAPLENDDYGSPLGNVITDSDEYSAPLENENADYGAPLGSILTSQDDDTAPDIETNYKTPSAYTDYGVPVADGVFFIFCFAVLHCFSEEYNRIAKLLFTGDLD